MAITENEYNERVGRMAAGNGTDEDRRLVKQYQNGERATKNAEDPEWDGTNSETSSAPTPQTSGPNEGDRPKGAQTTEGHSKSAGQKASGTARSAGRSEA